MLASYQNWVSWTYHNLDLQLDLPCTKTKTDIWLFPIGHHTISLSLAYRRTEEKYNIPWNILLISIFLESFIWLYKSQSGDAARESKMLFFLGQEMSFMVKLQGIGIIFPFTAQPGRVLFSTHNLASAKPSLPISHKNKQKGLCQNGKKYFGFCCDNTALLFESIFGYSPEIRSQGMECVSLGPGRKKWILGFYPPRI